jgi:hypothetical protein
MRQITVRLTDYVEEQKRRDRHAGRVVAALAIVAGLVIAMSGTNTTTSLHLAGTASDTKVLHLRNDGPSPLTTTITNDCATLAPNEPCSVTVVIAPAATVPQPDRPIVQTVDLSATNFGNVPLETAEERKIRFTNGDSPITIVKSSVDAPFAIAADGCSGTVVPRGTCEVSVRFSPTVAGEAYGELRLIGVDGAVVAKGKLLGAGNDPPPPPSKPAHLVVSPDRLIFTPQTPGTASTPQLVTVKNDGDDALVIASISPGDNGLFRIARNDCGQTLAGNTSCSVSIVYVASPRFAAAGHTDTLVIDTNAGRAGISLQVEVRSLPPVELPLTDFGRTLAGNAVERGVRFTNSAPATLVLGKSTSSPPFPISFDGCANRKIAPGDGCDVRLLFRPLVTGGVGGDLQIVDLAGDVVARGKLRGTGIVEQPPQVPSIDINPREINFHGDPGKKTIVITNTGPVPVNLSAKPEGASRYLIDTSQCNRQLPPRDRCTISIDGTIAVRIGASSVVVISYPGFRDGVKVLAR